jgi:hypothetical protein
MAQSDADYGKQEGTAVDLGATFGKEPTVDTSGKDIADSISQSPLAQSRGGADPENIGPGALSPLDANPKSDPVNDHAWSLGDKRYTPRY